MFFNLRIQISKPLNTTSEERPFLLDIFNQRAENRGRGEKPGVAREDEELARTRHGHVELAVDDRPVCVGESVLGEEAELRRTLDRESIDDVLALTALIALDRVDGDVVGRDAALRQGGADGGYLIAVRDYDADCGGSERGAFSPADSVDHVGDEGRFRVVDLVGRIWRRRLADVNEGDAVARGDAFGKRRRFGRNKRQMLVRTSGIGKRAAVEGSVGIIGYIDVHAALTVQHVCDGGVVAIAPQKPLEKRMTAVGQADAVQLGHGDGRLVGGLLHDGRKLLVVAYHDNLADGRSAAGVDCRED